MTFRVVHQPTSSPARSPFRIVEEPSGREVEWANRFLDRECLRRVAELTLRTYANGLLHFLRRWESVHHTPEIAQDALSEATLLEFVRFQSSQQPPLSGSTINERVAIADRALRALFPAAPGQIAPGFQVTYWRGARMTPAGLRSLFRYHRQTSAVKIANPHRFRHTFASDMLRAGVSLPALMHLMGHAFIQTTMVYIQITPLEVYQQYARAVAQLMRPVPKLPS